MRLSFRREARIGLISAAVSAGLLAGCIVGPGDGYYGGGGVGLDIAVAPPADRVYVAPPRAGYIYAPGYWGWSGRTHVWHDGHYMRERRGYHWTPDHWEQRNGRYHFDRGHWTR